MYYSQNGQDKWLEENIFKGQREGVFLDIGAYDGVTLSNTLFFEKERGWRGFCFEPHPKAFAKLDDEGVRESPCFPWAIWSEGCEKEFTVINGYSAMLSGLTDSYPQKHQHRIEQEVQRFSQTVENVKVHCQGINHALADLQAYIKGVFNDYRGVDLISIDTEGSELEILSAIDFEKCRIRVIACENNYQDHKLRELMKSRGFELRLRTGVDDIYINTTR